MTLRVIENGRIVVMNVSEMGAAYRASDLFGNNCPIKKNDRIIKINGVLLNVSALF